MTQSQVSPFIALIPGEEFDSPLLGLMSAYQLWPQDCVTRYTLTSHT